MLKATSVTTQPTKFRFDAIYIAAAGSTSPANTNNVSMQAASTTYGSVTAYGGTATYTVTLPSSGSYWVANGDVLLAQDTVASNSALIGMPGAAWKVVLSDDYQALGQTLSELSSQTDDDWRIDEPVYQVARYVAAELMAESFPAPKLFIHGPASVVFFWEQGANNNLYLTVSERDVSALVMSNGEIQFQFDFPRSALQGTSLLLPALESVRLGGPVVLGTHALSSDLESAE
jgi:hypothetical protein